MATLVWRVMRMLVRGAKALDDLVTFSRARIEAGRTGQGWGAGAAGRD
ncbi:hypothetical protein V1J52_04030 [Streptomyces sp. TRM 70351]|nr:hypothetical protein [Streptomyces sp. TRM 70351]MEE1927358.1 hypothetical protein [Streptomyces sp. TRM 70351]